MKLLRNITINFLATSLFFIGASFFLFPQSADACAINLQNQSFRFRTAQGPVVGSQQAEWFTEDARPFVYVDFQKFGECNSTTDKMYLTIFGLDENAEVHKTITDQQINIADFDQNGGMTLAFKVGEGPCYGNISDTSADDCLMFAVITDLSTSDPNAKILGILGNLITGISNTPPGPGQPSQAQVFANAWGGDGDQPTPTCANSGGHFYRISQNCPLGSYYSFSGLFPQQVNSQKFLDYYNTNDGNTQTDFYTLVNPEVSYGLMPTISPNSPPAASLAYPAFKYQCDADCSFGSDAWESVPNGILPYGETSSYDQGSTAVANPPSDIYQEEYIPLANLPFEGLNGGPTPSLGEYLASIFRMAIVVVVILAVIMIVFHGVAYATTGAVGKKDDHRSGVWNAILGLVLALGSWLLLNTVSPRLASQLSIGIPSVHLDGPDPAWDNGNAPAGTKISTKALLNGQPILQGMPWPDDTAQRSQLSSAGISVVSSGNSNCTPTAGTPNCTSVYFDNSVPGIIEQIISFKQACNCELIITGGSEAWLHSSHGPNKKILDFRATQTLNQYLNELPGGPPSGSGFPSGKSINISGVGKFYAEPSGATGNTTAKHWHVTFN